jgi:hypothetical protein
MIDSTGTMIAEAYADFDEGMREIFENCHIISTELKDIEGDQEIIKKVKKYYSELFNAVYWKMKDLRDEYVDSPNIRRRILNGEPEDEPYARAIAKEIWEGFGAAGIKEGQHKLIQEVEAETNGDKQFVVLLHSHGANILLAVNKIAQAREKIEIALNLKNS